MTPIQKMVLSVMLMQILLVVGKKLIQEILKLSYQELVTY